MTDAMPRPESKDRRSPYDFIKERLKSGTGTPAADLVTRLLVETGSRLKVFQKLVDLLPSELESYRSVDELMARDRRVVQEIAASQPQENDFDRARRDAAAMRPDKDLPSALEWFFLTIPGIDIPSAASEWKRLCEELELIEDGGALTLQGVIQKVLSDLTRTRSFILEVGERTEQMRERIQRPLTIYDVGCGPFPILALAAAIASPDSRIVCLEKNPLSAKIAEFVVSQLGLKDQIEIRLGDALETKSLDVAKNDSIDLLVTETFGLGFFDEPAHKIFESYTPLLSKHGETIPKRAQVSATFMPINRGATRRDGQWVSSYDRYVLNSAGDNLPFIPANDWKKVIPGGVDLSAPPSELVISGALPIPEGMTLEEFNLNYELCLCLDLDLGGRTLRPYDSFLTFPLPLSIISIPQEYIEKGIDPRELEVRFSYEPGSSSSSSRRSFSVARKTDVASNEIPEVDHRPIEEVLENNGIHPRVLESIKSGNAYPTPEAILNHPEVFDAFLAHIQAGDVQERMRLVPAVERYLKEIENQKIPEDEVITGNFAFEKWRMIVSAMSGLLYNAQTPKNAMMAAAAALALYAVSFAFISSKVKRQQVPSLKTLEYRDLSRRLLNAMRPDGERS